MERARCKGIGWNRCPENLKPVIKSAQEIQDRISSASAVTWDPFTVLPKEIYLKIFNLLDDPNDKQRFMNAHAKWYDLFKADRSLFLFEGVLKTVAKNGKGVDQEVRDYGSGYYDDSYVYGGFCAVVPKVSNGLGDHDYLNLRLVCRDWDLGMQNYIQFHPSNFQLGGDEWEEYEYRRSETPKPTFESNWILRKEFVWSGTNDLEAHLESILMTHSPSRNPFLTRNIRLEWHGLTPLEEDNWCAQVDRLFETYDHHIWHCKFVFVYNVTQRNFLQFVKWLSLMPELKALELYVRRSEQQIHSEWEIRVIRGLEIELPEMTKLSVIKCHQLSTVYFNKLLAEIKGPLDKVLIKSSQPKPREVKNSPLLVLQEGQFPLGEYQLASNVIEAVLLLEIYEDLYLKQFHSLVLRKLTLKIDFKNSSKSLGEWKKIWNFVEMAFPQLEELNLVLPKVDLANEFDVQQHSLNWRLDLPKLKKLKIFLPNLVSLDFLFLLRDLEELQIVIEYEEWGSYEADELGLKENIEFNRMDFEKMWESNIWEVFPNLRKLHIKALIRPWPYCKALEPRCYNLDCVPKKYCFCPRRRVWQPPRITFPSYYEFERTNIAIRGESPWHLYGYVKKGLSRREIFYDPTNPKTENWAEMYKLFLNSQSEI